MFAYSQKDRKWRDLIIGGTGCLKMKDCGCYIVAISCLLELRPDKVLGILNRNNCFTFEGELINDIAAKALGCDYQYTTVNPGVDCIGETDHWQSKGVPQHFFAIYGNSMKIIDPLNGVVKSNPYKVVSYRIFTKKEAKYGNIKDFVG